MNRRRFMGAVLGAIASVAVFKAETVAKLFAAPQVHDYYVIDWPVTSREWHFGSYVHEVLEHYQLSWNGQVSLNKDLMTS